MTTNIYLTKKLEKTVPKEYLQHQGLDISSPLGKWNATLFYVSRKKCWVVTNAMSKYTVILENIKVADFKNMNELFLEKLLKQLEYDGININSEKLKSLIGKLQLNPTDGDRSMTATQNNLHQYLKIYKHRLGEFENWNFIDITNRLNTTPYKMLGWHFPKEKIEKLIAEMS